MGKKALSDRDNWQNPSGKKANQAEKNLYSVFRKHFEGTSYLLIEKPTYLKDIYNKVQLPDTVAKQIFNPDSRRYNRRAARYQRSQPLRGYEAKHLKQTATARCYDNDGGHRSRVHFRQYVRARLRDRGRGKERRYFFARPV